MADVKDDTEKKAEKLEGIEQYSRESRIAMLTTSQLKSSLSIWYAAFRSGAIHRFNESNSGRF